MYELSIFAKRIAMIQQLTWKISVDVIPTEQSDEGSLKVQDARYLPYGRYDINAEIMSLGSTSILLQKEF